MKTTQATLHDKIRDIIGPEFPTRFVEKTCYENIIPELYNQAHISASRLLPMNEEEKFTYFAITGKAPSQEIENQGNRTKPDQWDPIVKKEGDSIFNNEADRQNGYEFSRNPVPEQFENLPPSNDDFGMALE